MLCCLAASSFFFSPFCMRSHVTLVPTMLRVPSVRHGFDIGITPHISIIGICVIADVLMRNKHYNFLY